LRIVGVHGLPNQLLGSGKVCRVEDIARNILILPAGTGKKKDGCCHQADYDISVFGHNSSQFGYKDSANRTKNQIILDFSL